MITNLGVSATGPVDLDIRKAPHTLISGTTGSGKSVAIHSMICDLLTPTDIYGASPWDCGLVLIDPKRVELAEYEGLPHVSGPAGLGVIYRNPVESIAALEWLLAQVELRFTLMQENYARDISQVPWAALHAAEQPRHIVLVVDELADLMMAAGLINKTERLRLTDPEVTLARILQIGRAAGVHCILATQRPSTDIVTGVIKANVPTRLVFALQNATDSRVAMGRRGAEELAGMGDALFLPVGAREPIRLQGRMLTDEQRYLVTAPWRPKAERPEWAASLV